jgi:hypothetical protein
MEGSTISERRVFRAAALPIFGIFFFASLIEILILVLLNSPPGPGDIMFFSILVIGVSATGTFFIWRFTAEVLSAEGVEIVTVFGRRLLPWKNVAAIYKFPILRLVCLRFTLASGRSRRVLFFQRRAGEFRQMIADLVRDESVLNRLDES